MPPLPLFRYALYLDHHTNIPEWVVDYLLISIRFYRRISPCLVGAREFIIGLVIVFITILCTILTCVGIIVYHIYIVIYVVFMHSHVLWYV